jgi:hypothetical protein
MAESKFNTALEGSIDRLPAALIKASREQFNGLLSRGFTAFERGCLAYAYQALHLEPSDELESLFDQWGAVMVGDECSEREQALYLMADSCVEQAMTMH